MTLYLNPVGELIRRPRILVASTAGRHEETRIYSKLCFSTATSSDYSVSKKSPRRRLRKMSPFFVVGIVIALVTAAHSQCIVPCPKRSRGGGGGPGWIQQLQQTRERALAQQVASEMSAVNTQRQMCGCCCAEIPCISDAMCTCPLEDCHESILGKSVRRNISAESAIGRYLSGIELPSAPVPSPTPYLKW